MQIQAKTHFDAELLRRYDRPGPRYTSYPTAPKFNADFGEAQLREALEAPSRSIVSGYGVKILETNDGQIIKGRYRNDSEQAIQMLSEDGKRWLTQFKRNLNSVTDSPESLMPDIFNSLDSDEQEALLAFLKSL